MSWKRTCPGAVHVATTTRDQGDFAIEGIRLGDAITSDARSADYVRDLIQELGQ